MSTLNVLLPDELRSAADELVANGRYASVSEYVATFIRNDLERLEKERTAGILKQRLAAGPAQEWTDADFDRIRDRLRAEITRRRRLRGPSTVACCR